MEIAKKFLGSKRANVAVTFSLAAIPLLAGVGMSVDYMSSSRAQSDLQQAVDNAALAAGNTDITVKKDLEKITKDYLEKNGAYGAVDKLVNVSVKRFGQGKLKVTAVGKRKNMFMALVGKRYTQVRAQSVVVRDFGNLELAMVLDNTDSMQANGKMDSLKTSAHALVRELFDNKGAGSDVKIGIVPFARYVNVGLANRNASWMKVPPDTSVTKTEKRDVQDVIPGSAHNCGTRTYSYMRDGAQVTNSYYGCDYNYTAPVTKDVTYTVSTTWRGCAGSRDYPLNVKDKSPNVRIPGIMNVSCPRPFTPLTDVKSTIDSEIDAMTTTGDTYIPAGLMWGWRLLSRAKPVRDGVPYNKMSKKGYTKAIVLMTDGKNTIKPSYPDHTGDGGDATTANKLTAELCTNIKNTGSGEKEHIKIYTVAYEVTDPDVKNLLQQCATNPKYYFDADNATALAQAFGNIAQSLITLRIAR